MDRRYVSFMYSYPNLIPLGERAIRASSEQPAAVRLRAGVRRLERAGGAGGGRGRRRAVGRALPALHPRDVIRPRDLGRGFAVPELARASRGVKSFEESLDLRRVASLEAVVRFKRFRASLPGARRAFQQPIQTRDASNSMTAPHRAARPVPSADASHAPPRTEPQGPPKRRRARRRPPPTAASSPPCTSAKSARATSPASGTSASTDRSTRRFVETASDTLVAREHGRSCRAARPAKSSAEYGQAPFRPAARRPPHLVHERLSKTKALAVFSSDALSSSAYATEEILRVLVLAGAAGAELTMPVALAIALLLAIVAISYRQTIKAYPHGGGSYIVSKDNLGTGPALVAASALLTDYVLTVAVSISAGVFALTSAAPDAPRLPGRDRRRLHRPDHDGQPARRAASPARSSPPRPTCSSCMAIGMIGYGLYGWRPAPAAGHGRDRAELETWRVTAPVYEALTSSWCCGRSPRAVPP